MGNIITRYRNLSKPVKASLWFMICGFLQRGISVLTTPIFTRLLSTEQYGTYSVFNSWLEVLTVVVTLKLAAGVYTQGLVKHNTDKDVFTSSLLGLATTSILIWLLVYLLFYQIINEMLELSTSIMLAMFAMMWATIAFNFWASKERVDYKYRKLVILTIFVAVAKPVVGIIAVLNTPVNKVEARVFSLAAVEIVAYIGLFITLMRKGKVYFHKKYWSDALCFNIPLIPHYLSKNVLNHSDRIMVKAIVSSSAAGIYSLAYNFSSMMIILNTSITNSLTPWMYKQIKKGEIQRIDGITTVLLCMIASANLLLIAVAPEIIHIFAPATYSKALYVIPPVTLSVFFQFLFSLFACFEFYYEKTRWVMIASVIGAVINVGLNAIFIPMYGYIAAAYTTLVCYIIYSFLHWLFMRRVCKIHCNGIQPYNPKKIILISSIFIFSGIGMIFLFPFIFERYIIVAIMIFIAFMKRKVIIDAMHKLSKKTNKEW